MINGVSRGRWMAAWGVGMAAMLAACAPMPPAATSTNEAAAAQSDGDRSLEQGVLQYQAARYDIAETLLKASLMQGISSAPDTARAHKFLAFIYCTSKREALCTSAFRSAREADPAFELSKVEAGHPLWGPVYRRVMGNRSK